MAATYPPGEFLAQMSPPDGNSRSPIQARRSASSGSVWRERYAGKHQLQRITSFPLGIEAPRCVRIYRRNQHYMLQWWDPSQKRTLSQRIDGDLIDAIVEARELDARLSHYQASGKVVERLGQGQLVAAFVADLSKRADAGEIDPRTVDRYRASLECHYAVFVAQPDIVRKYRYISQINRDFQLEFARYLRSRQVFSNGNSRSSARPMRGQRYVLDVVRSMLHWAADPNRGNLLPTGFQNPFRRSAADRSADQALSEPEITMDMAVEFLASCDAFQLPIFATLALYGLRPDELGWMFWEDIHGGWVRVSNHPGLAYLTKGRRDKQFPLLPCLQAVWSQPVEAGQGLLFRRRNEVSGRSNFTASKLALVEELERRSGEERQHSAARLRQLRDSVLSKKNQLSYDYVRAEFGKLAKQLAWPKCATAKDFRHLFATCLENAGVPESYRRFLMGHAPGRAAIVTYTHLNKLREHYLLAIESEFKPLVNAIERRAVELGISGNP